jgi:hypothetical protein
MSEKLIFILQEITDVVWNPMLSLLYPIPQKFCKWYCNIILHCSTLPQVVSSVHTCRLRFLHSFSVSAMCATSSIQLILHS